MSKKEFAPWCVKKQNLHERQSLPTFKEREIWWCSIGLNVGHEMDGKSDKYSRPVLVIRKFNKHMFFGVPTSLQVKEKAYYHTITFRGREQSVLLSQLRLFDSRRLSSRIGYLSWKQFNEVREAIKGMI